MNELTSEWIVKAQNDFNSADILLYAGEFPIPDSASFHCQQRAEKYLKAFLQEHKVRFERTHSLMLLLDLCLLQDQDFEVLRKDLTQLENYSVAVHYPGVNISVEIAEKAFRVVKRVRGFMRKKLGLN